jgi:hypothetical protein
VAEAYQTFIEMQDVGVQPDLKVYSALIAGFSQVGDHQKAQQLKEVNCLFIIIILIIYLFNLHLIY